MKQRTLDRLIGAGIAVAILFVFNVSVTVFLLKQAVQRHEEMLTAIVGLLTQ
jgi:hypothetical protein